MNAANPPPGNTTPSAASISANWLSQERLEQLTPRLQALLDDFSKLEGLAAPGTEPGIAPDYEGYGDEQR